MPLRTRLLSPTVTWSGIVTPALVPAAAGVASAAMTIIRIAKRMIDHAARTTPRRCSLTPNPPVSTWLMPEVESYADEPARRSLQRAGPGPGLPAATLDR